MIEADLRLAIVALHEKGMGMRPIARSLGIDRQTVRNIINNKGAVNLAPRADAIVVDNALLAKLYAECDGWTERVWEKLTEEHGVKVGYSTVTRKVRELGLGQKPRASHVGDTPGGEMQHDTSPHRVKIGNRTVGVTASLLYFRYSKCFYLVFYRSFDRFRMKCFFHEALSFYGYAAPVCIIDNTHLAVLYGTGKNAVMVSEMISFMRRYDSGFQAHEIKHSDRKAGDERGFWTVESNFLPGREFSSMEDLNQQAFEWATQRMNNRPRGKAKLIPAQAFEYEKAFLSKLPEGLPAPYRVHERVVDQYGFVAFAANFYLVPNGVCGTVKVLEYSRKIRIFSNRREMACYDLPPTEVRNKIFTEDRPTTPYQPRNREHPTADEEKKLREASPGVGAYLDFAVPGKGLSRHRFIRELFALYRRLSRSLFCQVIERAHRFRVTEMSTLEEIAKLLVREDAPILGEIPFDEAYADRDSFKEGRFTDPPDFSIYDQLLEDEDDE